MKWRVPLALACTMVAPVWVTDAAAQHQHEASPYADAQSEDVPTLSLEEVRQLRSGEGMGLARPAELNHYPGPKHLLALAAAIGLTGEQVAAIEAIRTVMQALAIEKGTEILAAKQRLAHLFMDDAPTRAEVGEIAEHLAVLRGELQSVHLFAHIDAQRLLTPAQISAYDRLRGYTN